MASKQVSLAVLSTMKKSSQVGDTAVYLISIHTPMDDRSYLPNFRE